MKQFLLTASACIGLFAFTKSGVSRNHIATVKDSYILADTTHKPKPDSVGSIAMFRAALADTTHKPKPDSMMVAMR
jgi:hypothetical protein